MFHWGEKDQSITLEAAQKVKVAQPQWEHHFYPAGHGFNCDQRGSFDAASAKLARERTLAFLRKHVG
jgi:carboxymethylenebutenolidase